MSDTSRLGTVLDETAYRDAVHIAITPVICDTDIHRGEWVRFVGSNTVELALSKYSADGVADPLLEKTVPAGKKFYVWLKPGVATNVRHEWDHPKFPETSPTKSSPSPENIRKALRIFSEYVEPKDVFCCGEEDESDAFQRIFDALLGE